MTTSEKSEDTTAWMQIYGQAYWHMPAKIYGDQAALLALRDAIDKALTDKSAEFVAFSSDGEGYSLSVHLAPYEAMDSLPLHYTHPIGRTEWDRGYDYAIKQFVPMINSLQERLRKLEGKPLRKNKLMESIEKLSD